MKKTSIPVILLFLVFAFACPIRAQSNVNIDVKTVLASKGKKHVDPGLRNLIRELESVLNYSSYKLISQDTINTRMSKKGTAMLPGGRMLQITPQSIKGKRIELKLEMLNRKRLDFQTVIQLRNRSSVTVGGPAHKGGKLLFNIRCSF